MKKLWRKFKRFFRREPRTLFVSPPSTELTQEELLSFFSSKQWFWLFEQLSLIEEATIESLVNEGVENTRELLYIIRYLKRLPQTYVASVPREDLWEHLTKNLRKEI